MRGGLVVRMIREAQGAATIPEVFFPLIHLVKAGADERFVEEGGLGSEHVAQDERRKDYALHDELGGVAGKINSVEGWAQVAIAVLIATGDGDVVARMGLTVTGKLQKDSDFVVSALLAVKQKYGR
ncbi:hypothetical protein FGB62_56g117 [Gracilaria domingensis]|nr:hypothetical protein FGB62_56g117 [Gracilaria domingensis]